MIRSTLRSVRHALGALAVVSLLSACGGGDGDAPPDRVEQSIGPAGGTLAHGSGASVTVAAGALAAGTTLAIETSLAGSGPALPSGSTPVGAMFDITPHGQTFTLPVTLTLPFDPALVPAGARVSLLKTSAGAAGPWVEVAGAVVSGNRISATVTSFSRTLTLVLPLPEIVRAPQSVTVTEGQSASFDVQAFGFNPPFTYQWRRSDDGGMNFTDLSGETAPTLSVANARPAGAAQSGDNGAQFEVLVGSVRSAAATLTVTPLVPTTAALSVSVVGSGSVASVPVGIACGADCSEAYPLNTVVALTATPAAGFVFSAWSGDADCSDGNLTMSAARNCIATFTASTAGTWQQLGGALDIAPADRSVFPSVALDSAGNPVVAWLEEGPASNIATGIHVKRWDGSGWVQLGDDLTNHRHPLVRFFDAPSIDVDPTTGQPVVAWSESSDGNPVGTAYNVYVKRWDGSAWVQLGGALNVDAAAGARQAKIKVTASGTPVVTWWETPNWTAAKFWNGSAWVRFGAQDFVSTVPTGSQDAAGTVLTLDAAGNPFVVFGVAGGPFAAQGSSTGWAPLGNGSPRTTPATAFAWGAANDAAGRLTVLFMTRDGSSTAADATTVRVRRIENGAWADFGALVLTADRNTRVAQLAFAMPYGTSLPIASVGIGTFGSSSGTYAQNFGRWDGTAWQVLAPSLPELCSIAVRAHAGTPAGAAPVIACLRVVAGNLDVVVYRLAP
ncbi:MAG: hypothetical protein ABI699_04185 [Caldimonas sp.]